MVTDKVKYSREIHAAVDIGSSKIVCAIGRMQKQDQGLEILAAHQTGTQGLSKGLIVDFDALEGSILKAVSQAEHEYGESIRSVSLNVGNAQVLSEWVKTQQKIDGYVIDENHLHSLLDIEATLSPERDFEVLFSEPLTYAVDRKRDVQNPVGMRGDILQAVLHVITARRDFLRHLRQVFKRCHLGIEGLYHTGVVSGLATATKDEQQQGITVIDVGSHLTTLAVFHRGQCVFADIIPVGGSHISSDISKAFDVPFALAERLKNLYGGLIISPADRQETITLSPPSEAPKTALKAELMEVIGYRVQEIFHLVKQRVAKQNLEAIAGRRYVLTGGASQLPGMRELGNRILEHPLRLGRPLNIHGQGPLITSPAFSTCAGLLYAALVKPVRHQYMEKGFVKRIGTWIRENL